MSVLCEAISVVVRCDVLTDHYPNGVRAYRLHCPNATYCSDGSVTRVGFMVPADAEAWISRLAALADLTPVVDGRFQDLAVVDQFNGLTLPCAWLLTEVGDDGVRFAWFAGTEPGPMVTPAGWGPASFTKWDHDEAGRLRATTTDDELDLSAEHYLGRTDGGSLGV